jgi:hypothetical protein
MSDLVPLNDELEFSDFAKDEDGMRERYHVLRTQKPDRTVNRVKVAQAVLDSFEMIGGTPGFAHWASQPKNRGKFYRMFTTLAPSHTDLKVKGEFTIRPPLPRNKAFDGVFEEGETEPCPQLTHESQP